MEKPIKKVLIITYFMIPYAPQWGGCQRMYFLAEYLQNQGFEVSVLHSKERYRDFGMPINFHPIPVGSGYLPNYLYESTSVSKVNLLQSINNKLIFIIQKLNILSIENFIFNEANPGMGIIGDMFKRNAKKCILNTIKERSIDYVIISAPPFLLFGLAPMIKKCFPIIKIIFDYRDPWNTKHSPCISTFMEKKYHKYADKIVFLNDRMLMDSVQQYGLPEYKCETVLNGYSKTDWDEVQKNFLNLHLSIVRENERMVLSYIGSGNFGESGFSNFSIFLDVLENFQKNKKVLVRFVGIPISKECEELKKRFSNNIEIIPSVSFHSSLNYMLNSDVQLLIHTNVDAIKAKYLLTGKFFDYIRSGKVIFGIGRTKDTYFLDFIEKHKLGLGCINQSTEILNCLEILYEHWESKTLNQLRQDLEVNIEDYSRDAQNYKFLKILEEFESKGRLG